MNINEKADEMIRKFHEALNNASVRANGALVISDKYNNPLKEVKNVKKSGK